MWQAGKNEETPGVGSSSGEAKLTRVGLACLWLWAMGLGMASAAGPKSNMPHWPACDPKAQLQTLSFVHASDLHAHYNPDASGTSPYARLRGYYERVKAENPFTLFTNAGDDHEKGSIAEVLSRGRTTREVVQGMGFHVRALGNHDFAWGLEEVLAFSHDPTALVLASNIRRKDPAAVAPGWTDYGEMQLGCLRVGFFSLLSKPWNAQGTQSDGAYYPELEADYGYEAIVREMVARHRSQVDLLVLVSHLGFPEDIRLAEATEGIDLILGGHSHTTLQEPAQVRNTTIVHAGNFAERVARLDLEFELAGRTLKSQRYTLVANGAGDGLPAARTIEAGVRGVLQPYREALDQEFAWVSTPLERDAVARIAARAAVERLGVDAALIDPASAWGGWRPGGLTRQAVLDTFKVEREPVGEPGLSSLYRVEVSGQELTRIRDARQGFAFQGPEPIDPAGRYALALQKPQAFRPGGPIDRQAPQPLAELWETVVAFGQTRSIARLAIDTDGTAEEPLIAFVAPSWKMGPQVR